MHVIVMAKEPIAGRVKTRLCPPCRPEEAAALAAAALADTLDAALASGADRVILALDGAPGEWCPPGITTIAQTDGPFDRRLAAAWAEAGGPGVQIGMDTPQVDSVRLDAAMERLAGDDTDAVLGPALDGGWWLIGLHRPDEQVFHGIAMSRPDTGRLQRDRLVALGLRVADIGPLRDVDTIDDAVAVAREGGPRFAATFESIAHRIGALR